MARYDLVMQRLQEGGRVLIDGATGTEIERRGVAMVENAWNGGGALTDPDIVREVHEDYIRAGAQVIISNTFSTSRHVLANAGMEEHFEFLNRRGVELAVEARENVGSAEVLVAGGMTELAFKGNEAPTVEQLRLNMEDQAAIMAAAGADLIMLEMMMDVERMLVTVTAAQKTGLPVWVGFSCRPNEAGEMRMNRGGKLSDALDALEGMNVSLVSIMHTDVVHVDECLDEAQAHWSGLLGVYAHSGKFVPPNWVFTDTISPEAYAEAAEGWMERGVQMIGGCCGIGIEHMEVLRERLDWGK